MRPTKIWTVIALPLLTLLIGWQLGVRYVTQQHTLFNAFHESGSGQTVISNPEKEVDISLIWSVWNVLQQRYIDPSKLQIRPMVYGAVSGLVEAIGDPYTVFMTPKDAKAFSDLMEGNLEGIGAQLEEKNGYVVIVAPLKSSPAEKAGLLPNDVIVKVDGKDVTGDRLDDIVSRVRGKQGTKVTLGILREKETKILSITIIRDAIHVPSVETKTVTSQTGSVAYIALNQFGDASTSELTKALRDVDQKKVKGLVLDLRFNGGGLLEGAVELVSMFLKEGKVVTVEQRGERPEEHFVSGNAIAANLPLVVLINSGSASASEITAGALQDLHRAKIVGTQSYGKGTVQQLVDLPGGSTLRMTIARWLTPSGHDLSKKGVTPDIVIDRTVEEAKAKKDPQLDVAVAWLVSGKDITGGKPMTSSGTSLDAGIREE
ncbi:MAG: S41 family peptidase [Candidatus Peribacteraceae bacterium]|nr:S41 family peptidase [Candidatus Peribacteraceae bacterium]